MTLLLNSARRSRFTFMVLIASLTMCNEALFGGRSGFSPSVEAADTLRTLEAYQEAILNQEPGKSRRVLYYELFNRIESGHITIDAGFELDRFVVFLASQLDDPQESDLARAKIADFLSRHSHPAARDALWRAASDGPFYLNKNARMALVALRDERVLDLLLVDARDPGEPGFRDTFRMIGELGSARAIEPLEAILADSSIEQRTEEALRAQQSRLGYDRDSSWFSKRTRDICRSYRDTARRALRDVRMQIETGMVVPFDLDDHAHAALARQGFVILPEPANELYEHLGSEYPYVTVDVAFHAFMILARASFDDLERLVLRPRLESFASGMVEASQDRLRYLRSGREVDLAHLNMAFFAVIVAILESTDIELYNVPLPVVAMAREELAKIREHAGVGPSSLFEVKEDFSKYKPRGRYNSCWELRTYSQAMLYLGRMKFRIESEPETARALLLLDVMEAEPPLRQAWKEIDDLLALFFGQLDDPGVLEYESVVQTTVPGISSNRALSVLRDGTALDRMRDAMRTLPAPLILTVVPDRLGPELRGHNRGFRVFGQRYSRSIDVFQQWMEAAPTRNLPVFPSGLHVSSSLLGSKEAERILRDKGYPPTSEIVAIPKPRSNPSMSLRESYLSSFSSLFECSPFRPVLTKSPAWEKRLLNSALGAWAEVIHTTMLYCKDANTYLCASMMLDRFHGYVDPYPEFFCRLGQYTDRFIASLEVSGLFDRINSEVEKREKILKELPKRPDAIEERIRLTEESMHATRGMFEELRNILSGLEEIARKELRGEGQSVSDGIFLKSLQGKFKHLAFNWSNSDHHRQSMALVSDPATEYLTRRCLQVGIGRPLALYVAVSFENRTFVCRGPVYSYYEFLRPIEDRLDDETWRRLSSDLSSAPTPWIAKHSELGFDRQVTRDELEDLMDYQLPDGRNTSGGREPWKSAGFNDPTKRLVTARVARSDLEVLIEMADLDTIHVDVRRFSLQKLKDFGEDPRVLDAYRRQLDDVEHATRENTLFHTRLYYTIQGLGSCGGEALTELERAEEILRTTGIWDHPKSQLGEQYRSALRESRRLIAAHPMGISRRPTESGGI